MKKMIMSFAFIGAIGGAIATQSFSRPLATAYFETKTANVPLNCRPIACDETSTHTCTLTTGYNALYKSITGQPDCFTSVVSLKKF